MIYKATDPIRNLPELLEQFSKEIAALERRIADLERDAAKQE